VHDANVDVVGDAVTDGGWLSAKFCIFDGRQDRKSLVQESDSDPIAVPKPIPQISMPRAVADLVFHDAQNPPEQQVFVFERRPASRDRLSISPKFPNRITALPNPVEINDRCVHPVLSNPILRGRNCSSLWGWKKQSQALKW
jgi:hypothetical protein